jgi:hypothetical protein
MEDNMKAPICALLACAAGLAVAIPAAAQNAPSPPAPPNYKAPVQKDSKMGLPDWSGVWNPHERNMFDPAAFDRIENKGKGAQDIREYPPYNAEWEAKYLAKLKQNSQGIPTDPTASCRPGGMPRIMTTPYPMEFVIEPGRVVVLHEISSQVRRIFTDGRPHPTVDELDPTYMGHSIGHWEGDTLVVDTVGVKGDTVYDVSAAPHSDKVHEIEHIRRISPTQIEDVMTIEDPVAFTKPWVVTRRYDLKPDWQIQEYVCEDNNRNPIKPDGTTETGVVNSQSTGTKPLAQR